MGLPAGVALSERGRARANMGVDAGDYDRSGRPDILVGNFLHEMLGLYRATEDGFFVDAAPRTTVGRASYQSVTWAVFFLDVDLDGHLDIFAANGGTDESQGMLDSRARLSQPPLLLRNRGDGTFEDVTRAAGAAFGQPGHGAGSRLRGFRRRRRSRPRAHRVERAPRGCSATTAATGTGGFGSGWPARVRTGAGIGAAVRLTSPSGEQRRTVRSGSSYASQSELPLTFGLGADPVVETLEVTWPSGVMQRFAGVAPNQRIVVDETDGLRRSASAP